MARLNRRIRRLECSYGNGSIDEWPPELLAAAFERVSDADLETIEGYCYPEGVASASSLKDDGWEREPDEDEAEAIARVAEHVNDIREERGL